MAITLIAVTITIIGAGAGLLVFLVLFHRDRELEKFYSESIKEAKIECACVKEGFTNIPPRIIVNSKHRFSELRAEVKKIWARITGKGEVKEVLVFGDKSLDEQKVFLIRSGFANVALEVFDIDFQESLVIYETYKFIRERNFDEGIKNAARKEFERCIYRGLLINIDSKELEEQIVLNPPPEQKSPLRDIILPIAYAKHREVRERGTSVQQVEKEKYHMMELIKRINEKKCAVLFLGRLTVNEYINMVAEKVEEFNSLLLGARGYYIDAMVQHASPRIESNILSGFWGRTYISWTIEGTWEFPNGKTIDCLWHFYYKT